MCCSPWGHKELDTTEQLNNRNYIYIYIYTYIYIYIYIYIVIESLCYKPETNTALQINCTSIGKQKRKYPFFPVFGYCVSAQQSGAAVAISRPLRERGCKPMAVSFQCMTKFTTNKKKREKEENVREVELETQHH